MAADLQPELPDPPEARVKMAHKEKHDSTNSELLNIHNVWMKANEEVFNILLNKEIRISDPKIEEKTPEDILKEHSTPRSVVIPITITSGLIVKYFMLLDLDLLSVITDLVMGGEGKERPEKFDDVHLGILAETINQISGSLVSILSDRMNRKLNMRIGKMEAPSLQTLGPTDFIYTEYTITIENVITSKFVTLIPTNSVSELIRGFKDTSQAQDDKGAAQAAQTPVGFAQHLAQERSSKKMTSPATMKTQMNRYRDISLDIKIVVGKDRINIRQLFEMGPGSIAQLESSPDEPVEIFVNDRFFGYGELVIIGETYGVRILEINRNFHEKKVGSAAF
jgi:flagellar motor switch protein FliN/FliY